MEGSGAQFDWVYATSVLSSVFARVVQKVERMIADAPIVLSTIFVLATLSVLLYYDYNLARKKGFRYPGAICLVAAFWMAALALASAVYSLLPESLQEKDYLFFSFLILIALVITPAFKLLLQALPTRSVRVYGQRRVRVPFIFLGTVVILVSSVALLNGIAGAIFGIPTGLYMIWLGRRLRSPQAPALLPGHNEPIGALYLRPFQQEPRYFVYGDRKKYSAYTNSFTAAIASLSFGETLNIGVTFEQYFRSAVAASVGPFVALGNPEDYIPPEGAFRLYAKDSDWKDRLDDLTKRASWILVEIGSSDALGWEFDHLRREGLQQKVFIITPPAREVVFAWWFIDFNRYVNGIGAVTWLQFAEMIAPFGYEVDRSDPGPGAVVTFDSNGKSVLLISDAKTPEDFLGAIRDWTNGLDNQMRPKSIHLA